MSPTVFSTAFKIYQWCWNLAIPVLYFHGRLKEGFTERTVKKQPSRADLWIQAASVGEAYLALEVLSGLNSSGPLRVLLTTNTGQGKEVIEKALRNQEFDISNLTVERAFFPFDNPKLMEKAVTAADPRLVVLLESELWPGLLTVCKNKGVKVLVINGRMTEKSLRYYRLWPTFWRKIRPDRVMAMSDEDARRFRRLFGTEVVGKMPNLKFDRISTSPPLAGVQNPLTDLLPPDSLFIVLASVRQGEEREVRELISDLLRRHPRVIIGLFPRHMHRIKSWRKRLAGISADWISRSRLTKPANKGQVILWDRMGELSSAYSLARAVFVGGSLAPLGGQNFLEPLVHGIRPVIGPNWSNFHWVGRQIIDQGLVQEAGDRQECLALLENDLIQPQDREKNRRYALAYFEAYRGGTRIAVAEINSMLDN
ncbi:MAG: 3-deoxy-D-manno-octulosonic acid transferase [Desulfurivibrionaceae bacterium]